MEFCQCLCLSEDTTSPLEISNVHCAYQYLRELGQCDQELKGYLTIDIIKDVHKLVLNNIHPKAGQFCLHKRRAGDHFYPLFETDDEWEYQIQLVLDRYNSDVFYNKVSIQTVTYLVFDLLSLHPFPDGNGRTVKLLANYVVTTTGLSTLDVCVGGLDRHKFLECLIEKRDNNNIKPLLQLVKESVCLGQNQVTN